MGQEPATYSVLIVDNFHHDPADDYAIRGFTDLAVAREFARRWVRDSIEELRKPGLKGKKLREQWFAFGEDAFVLGDDAPKPSADIAYFIDHPATPEERDWKSLRPER